MSSIAGRHVVVTGASRGIGASLAVALGGRGATVTVIARSGGELSRVADAAGGTAITADLTDRDDRGSLIGRVTEQRGPIDVLVNNAALSLVCPLWELSGQQLESAVTLNLLAPMELSRQVLPGMLERNGGQIVNVSSLAALVVAPTISPYCASKAGLTHFTAALQRELRGTRVHATIAQLGEVVDTDMMETARTSAPIAVASRRLNRLRAVPALTVDEVVATLVEIIQKPRRSVVIPKRLAPMHHLREIPNRLHDLVIAGDESKVVKPR